MKTLMTMSLLVLFAAGAIAHVTVSPKEAAAGASQLEPDSERAGGRPGRRGSGDVDACQPRVVGRRVTVDVELAGHRVHDDRPELHPDAVLEREGGLGQLVAGRELGDGHEHDLAALVVAEQFEHVVGLGLDR